MFLGNGLFNNAAEILDLADPIGLRNLLCIDFPKDSYVGMYGIFATMPSLMEKLYAVMNKTI